MPSKIRRPAARVRQGTLCLYATSLRVSDLLINNFYDIERLDPDDPDGRGYQRVLNTGRAKKLADYLISGQADADSFLPTSIFLATHLELDFDDVKNELSFDVSAVGPFSVVDGQHRLEGLRLAALKQPALLDFEVPVNIAVGLSKVAQMCHFLIVNTTQKSVDKSVEQRIYARLTSSLDVEDVPHLPRWIQRIVESGDDEQALRIVDYLNETPGSPWEKKIEMANAVNKKATIDQSAFVKSIKKYVLTANNPIATVDPEKQKKIILNYWKALSALLGSDKPSVLFKTNGVELFSRFSTPFFTKLADVGDYQVETMRLLLRSTFDKLEGEYAGVGHPDWWQSGGYASALNAAALGKIFPELTKALHRGGGDIKL